MNFLHHHSDKSDFDNIPSASSFYKHIEVKLSRYGKKFCLLKGILWA